MINRKPTARTKDSKITALEKCQNARQEACGELTSQASGHEVRVVHCGGYWIRKAHSDTAQQGQIHVNHALGETYLIMLYKTCLSEVKAALFTVHCLK